MIVAGSTVDDSFHELVVAGGTDSLSFFDAFRQPTVTQVYVDHVENQALCGELKVTGSKGQRLNEASRSAV